MLAVAFFRNLNLGHPRSPRREELIAAFLASGSTAAASYRTNGTVLFESPAPVRVAARVVPRLTASCGYDDVVLVRRERWLTALADRLPTSADRMEVTLFDARGRFPEAVPWRPARGGLTVLAADARHAVCLNDEPATGFGTPTLERLLGIPATSRSVGTMRGVVARFSGFHSEFADPG